MICDDKREEILSLIPWLQRKWITQDYYDVIDSMIQDQTDKMSTSTNQAERSCLRDTNYTVALLILTCHY